MKYLQKEKSPLVPSETGRQPFKVVCRNTQPYYAHIPSTGCILFPAALRYHILRAKVNIFFTKFTKAPHRPPPFSIVLAISQRALQNRQRCADFYRTGSGAAPSCFYCPCRRRSRQTSETDIYFRTNASLIPRSEKPDSGSRCASPRTVAGIVPSAERLLAERLELSTQFHSIISSGLQIIAS